MRRHKLTILATLFTFFEVPLACMATKQDPSPVPQRVMQYTSRPAAEAEVWQKNVRAKLLHLLRLDDLAETKHSIAFCSKQLWSKNRGTYDVKEVEINSTADRRIRIVVTVPGSQAGPLPAVVCVGGHGSDLYSPYDRQTIEREGPKPESDPMKGFGTVLAKSGYVTISTTVSQHEVYEKGRLLMGERLWDLIRCVDYLESMPEVDRSRIGCAGLSLGGEMTMWLAAMDERVAVSVSAGFLTSWIRWSRTTACAGSLKDSESWSITLTFILWSPLDRCNVRTGSRSRPVSSASGLGVRQWKKSGPSTRI